MIPVAASGFFTAFSLILAIGAQNTFVLRQGLLRNHVFAVALICSLSDAILIGLGVGGFGWLVRQNPNFSTIMALAGAAFLTVYGFNRLWNAWRATASQSPDTRPVTSFRATIATCLALTWLNPHVYLDTLGLIGAVSSQYQPVGDKIVFAAAAITASFVFFFGLAYGARLLAPVMQSSRAWRVFDLGVGLVMLAIATTLLKSTF